MDQEMMTSASIGLVLREARDAQKLSLEEVAARLRLSEKQINALESDDFSIFGSAIFARGFIKSYARFLTLDPQPLLDAHLKLFPHDQSQSITYKTDNVVKSERANLGKFAALVSGVLFIVVLVAWVIYRVWVYQSTPNSAENFSALNVEKSSTSEPLPEVALPAAERESTVTEITLPPAKESVDAASKTDVKAPADKPKEQIPVAEPAKVEVTKTLALAAGSIRVKLVLTGSSWIGVQDKNGKTVFSKLAKAGTEEFVEGTPPLKFHIGNASATQVIFNDETIDLTPNTYNNMARITVGEH